MDDSDSIGEKIRGLLFQGVTKAVAQVAEE
jgi:hypothetical protein